MKLCELRQKEVISICTCRSLGCPYDIEFDEKSGRICALIVSAPTRFWNSFFRECDFRIPWDCIRQIGRDIILVELAENACKQK